MPRYAVTYLKRLTQVVDARSPAEAARAVCPWHTQPASPDGNVLLSVLEGEAGYRSGVDLTPPKPPSGPTPGTPELARASITEAIAA